MASIDHMLTPDAPTPQAPCLPNIHLSFAPQNKFEPATFRISKLAPPFSITCGYEGGTLCDCGDLKAPYLEYRLHFCSPTRPNGLPLRESLTEMDDTLAQHYLRSWGNRVLGFNSRMATTSAETADDFMRMFNSGTIPQADIAVFPVADPTMSRLLIRLGATLAQNCVYDHQLDWSKLIEQIRGGALIHEWREAELEEGKIAHIVSPNPHMVRIGDLDPAGVFAAFYNNAPSPGMSGGARLAHQIIPQIIDDEAIISADSLMQYPEDLTIAQATQIIAKLPSWSFDYFEGLRMKLSLGTPDKPSTEINDESFDQCAFAGAARYLVNRYRRTGEVSSCLEYDQDANGRTFAHRPSNR